MPTDYTPVVPPGKEWQPRYMTDPPNQITTAPQDMTSTPTAWTQVNPP